MSAILDFLQSPKFYLPIVDIAIGIIAYGILKRVINHIFSRKMEKFSKRSSNYKKTQTLRVLILNIGKCIVAIIVILAILNVYGVNTASILAGLGLVGAVVGLAFQDVLKDFIAGITIILENQYAIGDNVEISGFRGDVIYLGLKTTKIKHYQGAVKILANRNITEVINYSMEPSLAIVEVSVSYEENLDKVEKVLNELAAEMSKNLEKITDKVEVLGITNLSSSSIVYRITVPTISVENFSIERKMRKMIKERFDENKIKIPYTQIEVHHGDK